MDKNKFYIAGLLFELYHVKTLEEVIFNEKVVDKLMTRKALSDRKAIYKALTWAANNADFEFKSVLQNAPVVGELSFSNSEIYEYLAKFKKFMENEKKLLTE
ncbi:hypothetical protein [Chryseobacterium takakiae]|jgi:hypothetical protein|uniref:Uncharacterized protein n=1 Tax=Chryseobacterium takakiae TaxID=1302685 RepID=A0A1M4V9V4_9FLAO|nr:hypothetical protein [Chryseobacterium takakiae]SHE65786.1 hypothetical protein SAMN05444408_1034 [Chryseobacterium takakiae]